MSDAPSEPQGNENTLQIISEQNADLLAYVREYQQQQAESQFTIIQLQRTIQKLQAKVSDLQSANSADGRPTAE